EQVECIEKERVSGFVNGPDVAVQVNGGRRGERVPVSPGRSAGGPRSQVAEDPLTRQRCQNRRDEVDFFKVALVVNENEEERLILLDRPAQAAAKLIAIGVAFLRA